MSRPYMTGETSTHPAGVLLPCKTTCFTCSHTCSDCLKWWYLVSCFKRLGRKGRESWVSSLFVQVPQVPGTLWSGCWDVWCTRHPMSPVESSSPFVGSSPNQVEPETRNHCRVETHHLLTSEIVFRHSFRVFQAKRSQKNLSPPKFPETVHFLAFFHLFFGTTVMTIS